MNLLTRFFSNTKVKYDVMNKLIDEIEARDSDLENRKVDKTTTVNNKSLTGNITINQDDVASGTTNKAYTSTEQSKLSGVATGATKVDQSSTNGNIKINDVEKQVYAHPSTHTASMIIEDASKRFVSDTEKSTWNEKETPTGAQSKADAAVTAAKTYTDTVKTTLENSIATKTTTSLNDVATNVNFIANETGKVSKIESNSQTFYLDGNLGYGDVKSDNILEHSITPSKISENNNLLNYLAVDKTNSVAGETSSKDVFYSNVVNNGCVEIELPKTGILKIKLNENVIGQAITFLKDSKVVGKSTYLELIGGSINNISNSYYSVNSQEKTVTLYCEKIAFSSLCESIILNIYIPDIYSHSAIGIGCVNFKNYEWYDNRESSFDNILLNEKDVLIYENKSDVVMYSRLVGYDTTNLLAIREMNFNYFTLKLDAIKYQNAVIRLGYSTNLSSYAGQRYILLDNNDKRINNVAFNSLNAIQTINMPYLKKIYPNLNRIEVCFRVEDLQSNYAYVYKDFSKVANIPNIDSGEDLFSSAEITHCSRLMGYSNIDRSILTELNNDYFLAKINTKNFGSKLKIPVNINFTTCQACIFIDKYDKAISNIYLPDVLSSLSSKWSYDIGSDFYYINISQIPSTATKIVFCLTYNVDSLYLLGINTRSIKDTNMFYTGDLPSYDTIEEIVLPSKYRTITGLETYIYYNNVVRYVDTDIIPLIQTSGAFEYSNKYARFNFENTGNSTIGLNLFKQGYSSPYLTKTIMCETVSSTVGNGVTKNVLFIGDSLTDSTIYAREIVRLFSLDVMDVNLLGTRGDSSGGAKHEGRSGWRAWEYVNLQNGEFGYLGENDFYNPSVGKFDFSYYMNKNNYSSVDYVFINLGTNDMARNHNSTELDVVESYNYMINSIKQFSSSVKIVLWLPPCRALGFVNTNKSSTDNSLRVNKLLINTFDNRESENIYLMPVYFNISPYHDYKYTEVNVSQRNSKFKELKCSDTIHPATEGYYKIADVIYGYIKYLSTL